MLARGDKVRDYEIIAPIRSGGMAMLYLARRRGEGGFSRLVALKLVHPHLTKNPGINRLFLQEARIAASVAHPNVVHVEEVGKVDGKYFIAMEYVHGVSLAELLTSLTKRRLRMSAKLCVWVAAQVSEALHAVHEATEENGVPLNIVHRDVSPQNILIGHTGHIKLIDFGIAKSQLLTHYTGSGASVLGKLGYMGPEQLRMQPVSRRTDVYALGVILWEMLASRNLLRCLRVDDERDWLTREDPPPPSKYAAGLAPSIDQAVLKAIACAPEQRYESALAFRAALLRAEPSASRVDAPTFAALMRDLLGEELEQRKAEWPSEVNVQLDSAVESTTGQAVNLEELTARLKGSDPSSPPYGEECDEPTLRESPSARRGDRSDDETVVRRPAAHGDRPWLHVGSIEAQIVTVPSSSSPARPLGSVEHLLRTLAQRARIVGAAISMLCIALAAFGAPAFYRSFGGGNSLPRGFAERSSAKSMQPVLSVASRDGGGAGALKIRASHTPPPLKLGETHIVSAAPREGLKQAHPATFSSSAQSAKRGLSARGKTMHLKTKGVAIHKSRKLRSAAAP